jgi:polyisoprenoid-binding protein YceI
MSTTETTAVPTGTWALDPVHSTIGFAVSYMAGTFTGGFSQFDAVLADGVFKGSAKVASVQVKDPDLATHLQSPDFFDAERYPELAFASSAIERTGNRIRIDGEITIKGRTEAVEITGEITDPIADPYGGERFGLALAAVIRRDEFGVSWNNPLPSGEPALSNDVTLIAELQLVKQT